MTLNNKVLIFESRFSAHSPEMIENIVQFLETCERNKFGKIYLALNKDLLNHLNIIRVSNYFEIIEIPNFRGSEKGLFISLMNVIKEMIWIGRTAKILGIDRLIFLQIDRYFPFLSLLNSTVIDSISGIYLNPYSQLKLYKKDLNVKDKIKILRKSIQIKLGFISKKVHTIFLWNDEKSVSFLNREFDTTIFSYLPDPINLNLLAEPIQVKKILAEFGIDESKKILLSIGGIQQRKNLFRIIDAISQIKSDTASDFVYLIVGIASDQELIKELQKRIKINKTKFSIMLINRSLTKVEFESIVSCSKIVFTIYSDFFSSSGIVGNSAKYGKLIIGSNTGVLKEIIEKYNLGFCVDSNNTLDIKRGIENYLAHNRINSPFEKNFHFLESHSSVKFCENLLSN